MPKVIVIGSANRDLTVRVERLPQVGETVSGGEYYSSFGGKGANQAVAAHKAGAEVKFLAKVGNDQNGEAITKHLEKLGLDSEAILSDDANATGVALIMVDQEGNNAIAVASGSNWNLTEDDVRHAESSISWGDVLLIQLEVPPLSVREALRLAKTHGLMTILNPAPVRPLAEDTITLADILTPNQVEAGTLTGLRVDDRNGAARAAKSLLEYGAGQVIVTLGKTGASWVQSDRTEAFSSFHVKAVDSTAAGDAFNGALACALAEGRPLEEAIPFANAAGALAVTRKGAQDSLPTREEIETLLSSRAR
jgi:ribokinase